MALILPTPVPGYWDAQRAPAHLQVVRYGGSNSGRCAYSSNTQLHPQPPSLLWSTDSQCCRFVSAGEGSEPDEEAFNHTLVRKVAAGFAWSSIRPPLRELLKKWLRGQGKFYTSWESFQHCHTHSQIRSSGEWPNSTRLVNMVRLSHLSLWDSSSGKMLVVKADSQLSINSCKLFPGFHVCNTHTLK